MVSSSHEGNLLGEGMMFVCGCFFQRFICQLSCDLFHNAAQAFFLQPEWVEITSSPAEWGGKLSHWNEWRLHQPISDWRAPQTEYAVGWLHKKDQVCEFVKIGHSSFQQGPKLTLAKCQIASKSCLCWRNKAISSNLKRNCTLLLCLSYNLSDSKQRDKTSSSISHNLDSGKHFQWKWFYPSV